MKLYIDESGSITSSKHNKNRFFVICFVHTDNPSKLIREFRKAKVKFAEAHPEANIDVKEEIKGSQMLYGMKKAIFDRITKNTDVSFHFKIIDNWNLSDNLVAKPSIAFNYFVGLSIERIRYKLNDMDTNLFLLIDERNQSVESLNGLQEYLTIKYSFETNHYQNVSVKYKDSRTKDLIQLADIFANTLYRLCIAHTHKQVDNKNTALLNICNRGFYDYFPQKHKENDFFI